MPSSAFLTEDHKALLHRLVEKLETEEAPFYGRTAMLNYWAWHITAGVAFLSSVVSALAASLMKDADFGTYGKTLLVTVPVVGAAATGLLHLYKFREKEALREEGRIELKDIVENAPSTANNAVTSVSRVSTTNRLDNPA